MPIPIIPLAAAAGAAWLLFGSKPSGKSAVIKGPSGYSWTVTNIGSGGAKGVTLYQVDCDFAQFGAKGRGKVLTFVARGGMTGVNTTTAELVEKASGVPEVIFNAAVADFKLRRG